MIKILIIILILLVLVAGCSETLTGYTTASQENINFLRRIVSKFLGATVSILYILWMLEARSKHFELSPWSTIIFLGFGCTFPTKLINSFLSAWPLISSE